MDEFDVLQKATEAGWVDPGYTEPLAETVKRAQEWLADRSRNAR